MQTFLRRTMIGHTVYAWHWLLRHFLPYPLDLRLVRHTPTPRVRAANLTTPGRHRRSRGAVSYDSPGGHSSARHAQDPDAGTAVHDDRNNVYTATASAKPQNTAAGSLGYMRYQPNMLHGNTPGAFPTAAADSFRLSAMSCSLTRFPSPRQSLSTSRHPQLLPSAPSLFSARLPYIPHPSLPSRSASLWLVGGPRPVSQVRLPTPQLQVWRAVMTCPATRPHALAAWAGAAGARDLLLGLGAALAGTVPASALYFAAELRVRDWVAQTAGADRCGVPGLCADGGV
jgi:hypothetical protein